MVGSLAQGFQPRRFWREEVPLQVYVQPHLSGFDDPHLPMSVNVREPGSVGLKPQPLQQLHPHERHVSIRISTYPYSQIFQT
jgi:hypothetical protein